MVVNPIIKTNNKFQLRNLKKIYIKVFTVKSRDSQDTRYGLLSLHDKQCMIHRNVFIKICREFKPMEKIIGTL